MDFAQPHIDRCPTCGKIRSATFWANPTATAAPATYIVPQTTAGAPQVFIPYDAPKVNTTVTYQSFDFCWCGWSLR